MDNEKELTPTQWFGRGLKLYKEGSYENALQAFQECRDAYQRKKSKVEQIYNNEDIWNNIGICYYQLMKKSKKNSNEANDYFEKSKECFEKALSFNAASLKLKGEKGRNWCSWLFLVKTLMAKEKQDTNSQYKESRELLEEIKKYAASGLPEKDAYTASGLPEKDAYTACKRDSLDDLKLRYFNDIVLKDVQNYKKDFFSYFWRYLADVYFLQKKYKEALPIYRKLNERLSKRSKVLQPFSQTFMEKVENNLTDCIEAVEGYDKLIEYYRESNDDLIKGCAYYHKGDLKNAVKFLKHVTKGRGGKEHARYYVASKYIAQCYIGQNDYKNAFKYYKIESEEIENTIDIDLYWNIGEHYKEKKKYEEAEKYLDMSLEAAGNDTSEYDQENFILYAEVKEQRKKYNEALELYNKALSLKKNAEVYCFIGSIHKELKDIDQAIIAFKEALEINPSYKKAKEQLEQLEEFRKPKKVEKEKKREDPSKSSNTQSASATTTSKSSSSISTSTEGIADIYYSFVSSKGNILGGPYRYQHKIYPQTTFKDMRKYIIEDLEVENDINVDNFFFSQRAEKPLFLDENFVVLENIAQFGYDKALKGRHVYLCPRIRYKLKHKP